MTTDLSNKSVEELRNLIGGCLLETHSGIQDNLAIALCSYFSSHLDRPETDPDTENGWGEWVEQKTNDALEMIAKTVARRLEEAQQQIARRDSAADDEAVLGDHNLIPSLQAEIEQLRAKDRGAGSKGQLRRTLAICGTR